MRRPEDIKEDMDNVTHYQSEGAATRGYLRIIAELLLDIREESRKADDKILGAIEGLKYS